MMAEQFFNRELGCTRNVMEREALKGASILQCAIVGYRVNVNVMFGHIPIDAPDSHFAKQMRIRRNVLGVSITAHEVRLDPPNPSELLGEIGYRQLEYGTGAAGCEDEFPCVLFIDRGPVEAPLLFRHN